MSQLLPLYFILLIVILLTFEDSGLKQDRTNKPLLIAHRGGAGHNIENTISAIDHSIFLQSDMIELDIQITRDKQAAIFHDYSIEKFGKPISALSRNQLHQLTLSSKPKIEKIPFLDEIFTKYKNKTKFLLEHKDNSKEDVVAAVIKNYYDPTEVKKKLIVQSFNFKSLQIYRKLLPDLPLGYLTLEVLTNEQLKKVSKICDYINPYFRILSPKYIEKIHSVGCKTFTWTLNSRSDLKKIMLMDVDGIVTDFPHLKLLPDTTESQNVITEINHHLHSFQSFLKALSFEISNL
ncbi:glycerophosphodiester phosphodiesterase [Bacillus sp. 2205SS5-2]|uniref:glycerophosphodiester phosphodiesterase n=1 Tax=Bacillus sp. 2205SS5-2 TaxID=3109031 RepID=UPI003004C53E